MKTNNKSVKVVVVDFFEACPTFVSEDMDPRSARRLLDTLDSPTADIVSLAEAKRYRDFIYGRTELVPVTGTEGGF